MSSTTHTPNVLWAQRSSATDAEKNVVLLTIEIVDPTNLNIDLKPTYLTVKANSSKSEQPYELKIDFFRDIDPENSKINTGNGNHIYMVLRKAEAEEEYWPRLTKEKLKYHYIKTDFDKWVDEDEQDEVNDEEDLMGGMGGMPGMEGMGGMGGMPGMGGMGGPGAMDFSQLLAGMGGAGGAGGSPDLSALANQLGAAGGKDLLSDDSLGAEGSVEDTGEGENSEDGEKVEEIN